VENRLASVAKQEGCASVTDLVARLRGGSPQLRQQVIEAMVTNETSFFRDVHPFEALRSQLFPALIRSNGTRPLSVWSAAASTGQEAFSLAMLFREHFPGAPVTILATDLSSKVLDRARTGRFSQLEVNRGLPAHMLARHFNRRGLEWELHDDIRRMVSFRQVNLARPVTGVGRMDVIMLRNLLIYFDTAAKKAVLTQMSKILRPDGYLFLGSAENTNGLAVSYERVQVGPSACYRVANSVLAGLEERKAL
jgi:chemotaxis protein methyltransferase CheR